MVVCGIIFKAILRRVFMRVLGEKSYSSMVSRGIILIVAIFACFYFGEISYKFYEALLFTKDAEVLAEYGALMDEYTFGGRRTYVSPTTIAIASLILIVESLIMLSKRFSQPRNLIECDEKGFYFHLPFNKSWYVLYEEVIGIRVAKFDGPVYVKKQNANWFIEDVDDYIEIDTTRMMTENTTGTITVYIKNNDFKISGVKNALPVAREMQIICNDGRRRRYDWLDEKASERRERELREKTKT
jgi:hypothetical protein